MATPTEPLRIERITVKGILPSLLPIVHYFERLKDHGASVSYWYTEGVFYSKIEDIVITADAQVLIDVNEELAHYLR